MEFKIATQEDGEELVRMRIAYLEEDCGKIGDADMVSLQKQLPQYFFNKLGNELIAFIAKDGSRVVSTVFLLVIEKPANPHFINGLVGEVLNVYTEEKYRHQGVASTLMKMMLVYAKENGLDRIDLSATDDGYPMYQKLGFEDRNSEYHEMRILL